MKQTRQSGSMIITLLVFTGIALYVTSAFVSWAGTSVRAGRRVEEREQALHIAEAGLEYYRWFLAHSAISPGEAPPVPDTDLEVTDNEGNLVGAASFDISAPVPGSTVIQVRVTGSVASSTGATDRTLQSWLAIPSFAKYSLASNDDVRLGEGTEVFGELHSNGGIRFDGYANNIVSSAKETYDDPDHYGNYEFGVHTHVSPVDPLPPSAVPERPDVFGAGRQFPVPAVDFAGITQDLSNMKAAAQADGYYFSPSGRQGYMIQFNTNDTFTLYQVRSVHGAGWLCMLSSDTSDSGWGLWSVNRTRTLGTYSMPNNGIIFVEDDVWVRGQIDGQRVTVAAGRFPDTPASRKSITVNEDLEYTNFDGTDAIALVAQQDINVGYYSDDILDIDAALVAQNGRVGRWHYGGWCGGYSDRNTITVNGMIASNQRYGFAYTDNTGYTNRNLIYDANLLYSPPPNFPLTSDQYEILTWEEIE